MHGRILHLASATRDRPHDERRNGFDTPRHRHRGILQPPRHDRWNRHRGSRNVEDKQRINGAGNDDCRHFNRGVLILPPIRRRHGSAHTVTHAINHIRLARNIHLFIYRRQIRI